MYLHYYYKCHVKYVQGIPHRHNLFTMCGMHMFLHVQKKVSESTGSLIPAHLHEEFGEVEGSTKVHAHAVSVQKQRHA